MYLLKQRKQRDTKMKKLPKSNQISNPTIKSLLNLSEMMSAGFNLRDLKSQADLKGFDVISKAKTFKDFKLKITSELKSSGLIII